MFSAYLLICACAEAIQPLPLASGRAVLHAITFYKHRRLSSLYHDSSFGFFFQLTFSSMQAWRLSSSALVSCISFLFSAYLFIWACVEAVQLCLAPGRAVLRAITFYMHRRPSSLCPGSRYKVLVFSLPFHLCMRGGYPASALAPGRSVLRAVLETGPTPTPFLLLDACSMHQLKMPLWRSTAVHQTKKKQMACQMSFAL